ncbi:MAG: diacylglycerol/lipid kinase family protein [Trueperaceae bacterium]
MKEPYPILINTRAGRPQPRARLEQLEHLLDEFGQKAEFLPTYSDIEMRDKLRELARQNVPRVAVVGGDGTLAQAVQELAYTETALSVLPLGTFNNFAASLNIPRDLHAALRLLWEGKVTEVDLGKVDAYYFTEAAGAGLSADFIVRNGLDGRKNFFRTLYGAASVFVQNKHYPMKLLLDGKLYEQPLSLCLVANSYRMGMSIPIASGAVMNDGTLNVVMVEPLERDEWWQYGKATWSQMLQTMPKVKVVNAQEIKFLSPTNMKIHCDDRFLLRTPVTVLAQAKALKVLVPSH